MAVVATTRSASYQLQLVTYTLVTSRLPYCNELSVGLPLKTSWKMELVGTECHSPQAEGKVRFH